MPSTLDLLTPDLLPTCPSCGDLSNPGSTICESCASPLVEQDAYRDRAMRLRDEQGRWIGDQ